MSSCQSVRLTSCGHITQANYAKAYSRLVGKMGLRWKVSKLFPQRSRCAISRILTTITPVYETSLYLSVVFDSPVQTTSILSHLVPDIYSTTSVPQPFRLTSILISLLHQLVISFPSQRSYLGRIKYLAPNWLERSSSAYLWISTLARSLRTRNFVEFEQLSQPDAFEHLLPPSRPVQPSSISASAVLRVRDLPRSAVHELVSRLRLKARDESWRVVRNAYREISLSDETQLWLGKRLFFDSFGSEATVVRFDEWVRERCRDGQLRPKEGVEGRWMVCKAR